MVTGSIFNLKVSLVDQIVEMKNENKFAIISFINLLLKGFVRFCAAWLFEKWWVFVGEIWDFY